MSSRLHIAFAQGYVGMGVTLNEISFEIAQFSRLVSEAVSGIAEGPPPSANDAENTSEARAREALLRCKAHVLSAVQEVD